jgi:catechol 2,3-dioxygenase-like lactoylglutathione lyase family enzyme
MDPKPEPQRNVKQAVPFFRVTDIEESVRYYVEGLGFQMRNKWIDEGKLQWCWLELDDVALMLQEMRNVHKDGHELFAPAGKLGEGVSICFMCEDALEIYRQVKARGIEAQRPFVGNGLWVTSLRDPDGYLLEFESPTDEPEETEYKG